MDEILNIVMQYDLKTLRLKLLEEGIKVGPIAPTTASLFQRRLAKHLFLQHGGNLDHEDNSAQVSSEKTITKSKNASEVVTNATNTFFAICRPEDPDRMDSTDGRAVEPLVFTDKLEALKMAKKIQGSRFKVFKSEKDAQLFTQSSAETILKTPRRPSREDSKETRVLSMFVESSPYKAPKPQELAALRKIIEAGDVKTFMETVLSNPRYLVSSGDTPAIYQEGPRYTAMHIAALRNQPQVCQSILDVLEDPAFMMDLYRLSKNTEETLNERINFLVDMHLNMPDKGNGESPLHMACKFGHEKVVEVLAAHPCTDKHLKNKWGETPEDMICNRCHSSSSSLKQRIELLLKGQCYVHLMRSEDNSCGPVVGQPWSPDVTRSPLDVARVTSSPLESSLLIRACAGPMSPSDAHHFHKRWTTPPSHTSDLAREYFNMKRSDSEKGMERIGRKIAGELSIDWKEYWGFLDQFVDLSTADGLQLLETHFRKKIWLTFAKDFMEKYCIDDDEHNKVRRKDITNKGLPTLVASQKSSALNVSNKTLVKCLNKAFDKETRNADISNLIENELKLDECKDNLYSDAAENLSNLSIDSPNSLCSEVSPMTGLLNKFSNLNLLDNSYSQSGTMYTPQQSQLSETNNCNSVDTIEKHQSKGLDIWKQLTENESSGTSDKIDDGELKHNNDSLRHGNKCNINNGELDSNNESNVAFQQDKLQLDGGATNEFERSAATIDSCKAEGKKIQRSISPVSSESGSYETALEDLDMSNQSVSSQISEPEDSIVCLHISDRAIIKSLVNFVTEICVIKSQINSALDIHDDKKDIQSEDTLPNNKSYFILQWKPDSSKICQSVSILSMPVRDRDDKFLLIENVSVCSIEGEISQVQEGDKIAITYIGEPFGEAQDPIPDKVYAFLTKTESLPKCGYIHGPWPTREDLDVARALEDTVITPGTHPNVFHWKLSLNKFLKDTSYRWQSPVKVKSKLRQVSRGPLAKTSPVLPYASPLGMPSPVPRNNYITGIRTKLFPSITE